jgi:hypothetical protein
MTKSISTVQVGDLVTAAFDAAAQHAGDAREQSRLATQAITHLLRRARITAAHRALQ